jgi:outer membrane translocation and assembly module TamA
MYLHSAFELRRYFTPDLAAHFHVELAKVWEDGTKLDQGSVLRSVGVGLTYQTPIGLQVGVRYSKSLTVANTHSFGIGLVHPF